MIGGARAVVAWGNELCSMKGVSALWGVTNDANGVTVSVLGCMFQV